LRRETSAWDGAEVGYYPVEDEVSEGGVCYGEIPVGEVGLGSGSGKDVGKGGGWKHTRIRVSRSEVW